MSYLQCPECRLTVPAAAYYLRGDDCPRCMAKMEKRATFRSETREGLTSDKLKASLDVRLKPPPPPGTPASPAGGSV